jgi:integrase/recombinase XerC
MTAVNPDTSQQALVEGALVLLKRMGLSPADLTTVPQNRKPVPTFAEYVPVVSAAASAGTRRAYGSYCNRITEQWGRSAPGRDYAVGDPAADGVGENSRGGTAQPTRRAQRGGAPGGRAPLLVPAGGRGRLAQRGRQSGTQGGQAAAGAGATPGYLLPSTRRAVPEARLAEIDQIAATTGDEPERDTLLLRTETACRRGGALALRPQDLDPDQCLILLREKGETVRWQPVSPTLMGCLT